ncbi:hypothetical protein XELAEV_18026489mg, partial [Xenopus laevis]
IQATKDLKISLLENRPLPHKRSNNQKPWFQLITLSHHFPNCLFTGEPSAKHAHSRIAGSSFHLLLISC